RQAAGDLERALGKDRDPVEALLPVGLDVVSKLLHLNPRELVVEALDLLQTERVRRNLLQVVEEMANPLADRIDVPGGDAQGAGLRGARRIRVHRATGAARRGGRPASPPH